jgi:putative Ca2+/H+ antiporter (TMEM165/GDT1 family)
VDFVKFAGEEASVGQAVRIGAVCIAEIGDQFFLLVEFETEVAGMEIERVVVFKISAIEAAILMRLNVRRCRIVTTIPTETAGREVKLICAFVVGEFVFLVFDVENGGDNLVLVRVPLCTVI